MTNETTKTTRERVLSVLKAMGSYLPKEDEGDDKLTVDSLGRVTLLLLLEDEFGIRLRESDMDPAALMTVSDVVCMVEKYEERT